MIETPEFIETPSQPTAIIRLSIPRAEIANVLMPCRRELFAALAAQGVAPMSAWFAHHLRIDPEVFDFEVGVAVAAAISPAGRVEASVRPAERLARTVYRGGFAGIGAAWEEFDDWIVAQGCVPAVDMWMFYVDGPPANPDPATWRTELLRGGLR